jgi:hypothetical protein
VSLQRTVSPIRPMIFGLLCVAGSLILVLWNVRWVISAVTGPQPMTAAELRQVPDPPAMFNPWVTLSYDASVETNLAMATTKGGQKTQTARFILISLRDRWLIAEVPPDHRGNQVTGYLDVWSAPLRRESIQKIESQFPQMKDQLLPYQLDAVYGYRSQCIAMLILAGIFFVLGLWMFGYGAWGLLRGLS